MWKKTWLIGILVAATTLSGCSCGTPPPGGGPDGGGGNTTDGGPNGGTDGGGKDGGGGDDGPTIGTLTISPTKPLLTVSGSTSVSQGFTVMGTFSDGHTEDVTSQATFSIDDTRLGLFLGSTFNSRTDVGGTSFVRARIGTKSVSTDITVKLDQKVPDTKAPSGTTPLPANPDGRFGGTVDVARKPQVVYPNHGVMVPPNLGQLEIHFLSGPSTNSLFELQFSNTITDVRVYLRCYLPSGFTPPTGAVPSGQRGCIYTPEDKVWKFLAESNRGGQPVRLIVRATDDTGTGTVGVSDPISIQFARAEIKGALYYWTTSGGTGVMRYDFAGTGTPSATPVLRASNINTSVSCVGCHALSRNGKKLVAEVNGQNDGRLALIDLSTFDSTTGKVDLAQGGTKLSNFESWNPDGTKFVGTYADSGSSRYTLKIFNGDTAAYETEITGTGTSASPANHPDWSADGQKIAYMSMGVAGTNQRSFRGAIKMVTAKTGGWNEPVTVVASASGRNRYYPAIAPDSSFLVFNESVCPSGDQHTDCNGDTDPSAKLWAAKLESNTTPVELANANKGGVMDKGQTNLTNSYPKWSPFVTRGNNGDTSRLMWVTFSSSRKYGLRQPVTASGENPWGTLLWMAAVDPDKVGSGDPSYAAFALPFQDINTSNHIAQWASYFVSNGCRTDQESCGSGSTCCNGLQCVQQNQDPPIPCDVEGACLCQAIPVCKLSFEACSTVAPCCDGLRCLDNTTGADCAGGSCTCTPPCSGFGQTCGGASACCDGLLCVTGSSGRSTCQPDIR
jgi:Tol biopolymer transport system component